MEKLLPDHWFIEHSGESSILDQEIVSAEIDGLTKACIGATRKLLDEIERLRAEREWRPIETAPKDGTPFIGWVQSYFRGKGGHAIVLWHGGEWFDEKGWKTEPVCWQPLPTPPVNRPCGCR